MKPSKFEGFMELEPHDICLKGDLMFYSEYPLPDEAHNHIGKINGYSGKRLDDVIGYRVFRLGGPVKRVHKPHPIHSAPLPLP